MHDQNPEKLQSKVSLVIQRKRNSVILIFLMKVPAMIHHVNADVLRGTARATHVPYTRAALSPFRILAQPIGSQGYLYL